MICKQIKSDLNSEHKLMFYTAENKNSPLWNIYILLDFYDFDNTGWCTLT